MKNNIEKVVIFASAIQQRVIKLAYSFHKLGVDVSIYAEENAVSGEFENYMEGIMFTKIPVGKSKIKRTPLGRKRRNFIDNTIEHIIKDNKKTLVIARDVNYGYLVGKILSKKRQKNINYIIDVADNYDLLYDSYNNILKRCIYWFGFNYITKKAFYYSKAIITVCNINKPRLEKKFKKELFGKKIIVLKNLPIEFKYIQNKDKVKNSFVYVGKIDETSRDPMYILEKLVQLPDYEIHFYSSQKKNTIDNIKKIAERLSISERVIFHNRVPYDRLALEISRYQFGLVPHKRCEITDYTLPNKMYDYKSSGIISIMSSCPSLIEENKEYAFGLNYSKENDNFIEIIHEAERYSLDTSIHIPCWEESFLSLLEQLRPELI